MSSAATFLAKIEAFLSESGLTPTVFGLRAVGDGNFVRELKAGRMPSLRLVDKVDEFMRVHRSQNLPKASGNGCQGRSVAHIAEGTE